ncbi:glucose 1-dehydrogenase [Jiella pelagia]|uniref:Glucose 1-dehydrogenase n=1 Tax=Jiella pelagia TaxID=2986949 RepID=A0ABY7C2Z2_9HYPH|nr:glucose 1-dehydrogenase [Jiella pelagia]WAP70454.1 glucose 1-dehydrogenase [Jiella pelagia]
MPRDPRNCYPRPEQLAQQQDMPGDTDAMMPKPDHGEESYEGHGRLKDRVAIITGGDSGIGRAIAIAYAREGADVIIAYWDEHDDAKETAEWVEKAGRKAVLVPGDVKDETFCNGLIDRAFDEFGRLDILINNAAHQATFEKPEDISATEWDVTFRTNIHGMFYLSKRAVARMEPGGTIINTASINSTDPSPGLLAYATTKGAIQNFTAGLCRMVADRGIRVNAVAPGPVWTPLIPSTMPQEKVKSFGGNTPLGRAGQPAELAGAYVFLASEDATYITGAVIEVTGGRPML